MNATADAFRRLRLCRLTRDRSPISAALEGGGYRLGAQQISRIIMENSGAAGARSDEFVVEGPLASTPNSEVFRGSGGTYPVPVAIKVFRPGRPEADWRDAARIYFDAMAELCASTRDPDFGIARPMGIIADYDIVITEWIDGLTFHESIARASSAGAKQAARKAGLWLARLHNTTGSERRAMDTEAPLARLRACMEANPRAAQSRVVQQAATLLQQTAPRITTEFVSWSRLHGDFKPENLLVRNGGLFGIDLHLLYHSPGVQDAAYFINHMHLGLVRKGRLHRLPLARDLAEAFRQGYVADGKMVLPAMVLRWERVRNALELMLKRGERSSRWGSAATDMIYRWLVRQLVRELGELTVNRSPSGSTDVDAARG